MGEYVYVNVYRPMKPMSVFSNPFEKMCWGLYEAKDDQQKIEKIYRDVNFVGPGGHIFDLMMQFKEKDGIIYQTNTGILGSEQLPNLELSYKFDFPDFWLSMLKPSEMNMNEHDIIHAELMGRTIIERFELIEIANRGKSNFRDSDIYKLYHQKEKYQSCIAEIIQPDSLVKLMVGHIYYMENQNYRDRTRERITEQRKKIASHFHIPHWEKTSKGMK